MNVFAARNISLILMLAAFPLISIGTTGDQPLVWWVGVASLTLGAAIPPAMRFLPKDDEDSEGEKPEEHKHSAPDLGDSCRVC